MKKLALVLAGAFVLGSAAVASADPVSTPIGTLTVNEGGYAVVADGDAGNPDPLDGYVSVSDGGQVCADDTGNTAEDDGGSPTCTP